MRRTPFAYRYAANQFDRLPALAAELVQLAPDVIWMHSNAAALAAKQAITTIPVVNAITQEIMELGVVESLARPGGNLTGLDVRVFELMGKRLELLKEAVPTSARVAILVDPANPIYKEVPHNIAREAWALGVQLQRVEASGPETFEGAFAAMVQDGADAVMLPEGPPLGPHMPRLVELGPPATNAGKFTVRLFDSLTQPLHVDFYRHVQWLPVPVTLSIVCQRRGPDKIGAIGDDMGKG